MIVTLNRTIPSNSHNAPYSEELGEHWPAGTAFKLLPPRKQASLRKFYGGKPDSIYLEQVGGEEVLLRMSMENFAEYFRS